MDLNNAQLVIINKALYKIGAKRISALPDTSPDGVIIGDIYEPCLNEVLEEHPWSFAINTFPLVQIALGSAGAGVLPNFGDGVSIAYALPPNFLSGYMVNYWPVQLRQEMLFPPLVPNNTVALLSDTPGLIVKYVFFNNDPTTYSAKFSDALACRLALEMCSKVTKYAALEDKKDKAYKTALMSAMAADSKNSVPDQPIANEWEIMRLQGAGAAVGYPDGNIGWYPMGF
jgi:hypothetical protein